MQGSTLLSVHRLLSGHWEPPDADALSLASDLASATRALVAPFLARTRAGSSTTAQSTWLTEPVHSTHLSTAERDEARLLPGLDNYAAPLRSGPSTSFAARARAGGHTIAPYYRPRLQGPATLCPDLKRGASRQDPSTDVFTLPFQALLLKSLQREGPRLYHS